VEEYYVGKGILMPGFHKSYWVGLRAASWPNFAWIDRTAGVEIDYSHWGTLNDGSKEPNNAIAPELCGLANYTLTYGGVWGWSDTACSASFPFICRMLNPGNITMTSAITNNSFIFFTDAKTNADATAQCNSLGMHLASFENQDEQAEIEAALIQSVSGLCMEGLAAVLSLPCRHGLRPIRAHLLPLPQPLGDPPLAEWLACRCRCRATCCPATSACTGSA
jgi:hypothetical protein